MINDNGLFKLSAGIEQDKFHESTGLTLDPVRGGKEHYRIYDTFDWLILKSGRVLTETAGTYYLFTGKRAKELKPTRANTLEDILTDIVFPRKIYQKGTLESESTLLNVLNEDRKTVVRLELNRFVNPDSADELSACLLMPVRGYHPERSNVEDFLTENSETIKNDSLISEAVHECGYENTDYSTKKSVANRPEMPADSAVRAVMLELLEIIEMNEAGTCEGKDIEFLHDYRVSVRRMRSYLSRLKELFSDTELEFLTSFFKELGSLTGEARDADVYLLRIEELKEMLPSYLDKSLEPLHDLLKDIRKREYSKIRKKLKSAQYKQDKEKAKDMLVKGLTASASQMSVYGCAVNAVSETFEAVAAKASKIDKKSEAEKYHKLRIQCKKLRYMLELFAPLFGSGADKCIKELKKLQDGLGLHQDLEVQQVKLVELASMTQSSESTDTLLASGYLICALEAEQDRMRAKCLKLVKNFMRDENINMFRGTFTP